MKSSDIKSRAQDRWLDILPSLGIPVQCLDKRHHPCPACGGKDRFRFTDRDGRGVFICNNCGAGDGFKLLMNTHGWSFTQALKAVSDSLSGISSYIAQPSIVRKLTKALATEEQLAEEKRRRAAIEITWSQGLSIVSGDPVDRYLCRRGIYIQNFPADLRHHPSCPYWENTTKVDEFPALLAAVRRLDGELVNIRRIYLTPDGVKAPVPEVKKLMKTIREGALCGASTRLAEPDKLLCISEGIENGLAVQSAVGVPTWAAGSSWSLENIEIPPSIEEVWIAADNDERGAGLKSARTLSERLQKQNITVKISMPNSPGSDWNDVLEANAGVARNA